jgi:parallel beta-helix repeat protein
MASALAVVIASVVLTDTSVAFAATGRGSAAIGSASYAAPAGAVFVDPAAGKDTAAGSKTAPMKTVDAALKKVASGGTIVLRKGTYHEKVMTPANKGVTIQAYPAEAVWFDGSVPVSGWTKAGANWVHSGWTTKFDHSASFSFGQNNKAFVNAAYPMAAYPDQVFLNGVQLRQVASAAGVTSGTFAVDYAAQKITIGSDPTGKEVRASDLDQAITVAGANTKLLGFGVRRYGNPIPRMGAVYVGAANARLADLVFQDNATTGLSLYSPGIIVDHITVTKSGLIGVQVDKSDNLTVSNSIFSGNNSEHFNWAPVSAGFKITKSKNVKIINNEANNNVNCTGIWLDQSNVGVTIVNNTAQNNGYAQIEAEISQNVVIAGNVATGGQVGLFIYNSGSVKVYNNTLGGSAIQEINLTQDERRSGVATVPWLLKDVYIANNVIGTGGVFQIMALDKATHIPADKMNITITGNLFSPRATTAQPTLVGWGLSDNTTRTRYDSVAALKAKNALWKNAQSASVKTFNQMSADATTFAPSVAVGLPADVASAMGQPAGTKRIGSFLPIG